MGGSTIPTADTPGYTSYPALYGPDVACYCLAQWLRAFRRLLKAKGLGDITVWQLTGANEKSAGTHLPGGVVDWAGISRTKAMLAREGGGVALPRDWDGNRHTHTPLIGCAHNSGARYQIDAVVKYRRDGLGSDGKAGPDPLPAPSKWRTWREGVEWFDAQTKKLQPAPAPAPAPAPIPPSEEDELMALTVKNPLTGEEWPAEKALWSIWTYAYWGRVDAKAALEVAKVAAQKGEPLTAEETEAVVKEAVAEIQAAVDALPKA